MSKFVDGMFIGGYTGLNKSGKPYFCLYIAVPMVDKDGNSNGIGYRPLPFYVEKNEYMDFAGLSLGVSVKINYTYCKQDNGTYRYILKNYSLE